jgi:hypothetical protein
VCLQLSTPSRIIQNHNATEMNKTYETSEKVKLQSSSSSSNK